MKIPKNIVQEYVLGFVFNKDLKRVLLIRKQKPEWQKGKLNGIGGKIELNETPFAAMSREMKEEADLDIPTDKWTQYCILNGNGWMVYCFYSVLDGYFDELIRANVGIFTHYFKPIYKSMTDEEVGDWWVKPSGPDDNGSHGDYTGMPHMSNLKWLIPMALNHYNKEDNATFEINEIYE